MAPCDAMEPASSRPPIEKTLLVVWCDEPVTHRANGRRRPAERRRGVTMRSASRAVAQIAGAVTCPVCRVCAPPSTRLPVTRRHDRDTHTYIHTSVGVTNPGSFTILA